MSFAQALKKEVCYINNCGLYAGRYSDSYGVEVAGISIFFQLPGIKRSEHYL